MAQRYGYRNRRERLMHPLHDYVAKQLGERLRARCVVGWYDVRVEFAAFVVR